MSHAQLKREIRYGELSTQRHKRQMRAMMQNQSVQKAHEMVQQFVACFDRVMDSKDCEISLLLDELQAVQEQMEHSVASHVEDIDRIIILCHDQIADLQRGTRQAVDHLYQAGTLERHEVVAQSHEHEDFLKTMHFVLKNTQKEWDVSINSKQMEIVSMSDSTLEFHPDAIIRMRSMQRSYKKFLSDYLTSKRAKSKLFAALSTKDQDIQALIKRQWRQLHDTVILLKGLRTELRNIVVMRGHKCSELLQEKIFLKQQLDAIVQRARKEARMDEKNLMGLIATRSDSMQVLGNFCRLGERLLTMATICHKYETKSEQIAPFPHFPMPRIECRKEADLKHFWLRCAAVESQLYKMREMVGRVEAILAEQKWNADLLSSLGDYLRPMPNSDAVNN